MEWETVAQRALPPLCDGGEHHRRSGVEVGYLLPAASKKRDLFGAVRPGTGPKEARDSVVTGSTVPKEVPHLGDADV